MPTPFEIPLSASDISTALQAVVGADFQPTSGSVKMAESGGTYQQIQDRLVPVIADVATNTAAIAATNAAIPAVFFPRVAKFTKASGSTSSTTYITGYTESDPDSIATQSGGNITITGAGAYVVSFSGTYDIQYSGDPWVVTYSIGGSTVASEKLNYQSGDDARCVSFTRPLILSGSTTLSIHTNETGSGSHLNYTYIEVSILQIA
jgi:hypothetical protein